MTDRALSGGGEGEHSMQTANTTPHDECDSILQPQYLLPGCRKPAIPKVFFIFFPTQT